MSLAPRLDLRQSQALVMTPRLQQAIKLLQLSNLEIEAFLAEELEKNPLLAADDGGGVEPVAADAQAPPGEEAGADERIAAGATDSDPSLDVDHDATSFDDAPLDRSLGLDGAVAGEAPDLDQFGGGEPSLREHLNAQAGERLAGADLVIARHIIDLIDEAGYLAEPLAECAARLGIAPAEAERVLAVIQGFDPTGVGARDLGECIALQAREADRYDPCMARLIANLALIGSGELPRLRRLCQVDEEDFADMLRELRGYDPKPGLRYGGDPPLPVSPDVFVRARGGGWAIELNGATMPRLLIDRRYHAELSAARPDKAAKAWLGECLASAGWLVKTLDQRAQTIVRVATEIVKRQEGFFRHGVTHLRPLTLKTVADELELHESTISRVTSNKYLSCERGLFELKYFFSSGVASEASEEGASAQAVKAEIARAIAAEGDDILSDDRLMELLNARGYGLARRTVAKYREAIGLGSSVQRRRARALRGA